MVFQFYFFFYIKQLCKISLKENQHELRNLFIRHKETFLQNVNEYKYINKIVHIVNLVGRITMIPSHSDAKNKIYNFITLKVFYV